MQFLIIWLLGKITNNIFYKWFCVMIELIGWEIVLVGVGFVYGNGFSLV